MRTQLSDGTPVKILFTYHHYPNGPTRMDASQDPVYHTRLNGKVAQIKARTTCDLIEHKETPYPIENVIARGESWCSVEDNFSRKVGREQALRRAISALPKEDQGRVLHAYYNRARQGRRAQEVKHGVK
ncbi:MAG TPA: hypothetical protein VEI97_06320 [bacterium]|nr:hypothetical protein [bacterium]